MKILRNTLSLEELEQLQSNAPDQSEPEDPQDPPSHDEVDSTGEEEVDSTGETGDAAEEQAEANEAYFLTLGDLAKTWVQTGSLTGKMLRQANEALPSLQIANGVRTHAGRYQLAMEGILAQFETAYQAMTPDQQKEHAEEHAKIVDSLVVSAKK